MPSSPGAAQGTRGIEIPGPGTYNHATDQRGGNYLGDAPSYTMGARKSVPKADSASPGPVYSPRTLTPTSQGPMGDAPQYSFGNSKRFMAGQSGPPGPGQYAQTQSRTGTGPMDGPKYGFGTSSQRVNITPQGNRFISKDHASKSNYAVHCEHQNSNANANPNPTPSG